MFFVGGMAMNIQIFGTNKSFDTKKARRRKRKGQGHAGAFEMTRREPAGRQAVREPAALPPAHCAQRQTGHRRLLPRGVGEVGVRQTAHLSLQEPRTPTDLRTRP